MPNLSLPEAFKDLEPLVASGWALATERERNTKHYASTLEELQEVYDTLLARIDDILEYLNEFPLDNMPEDSTRLLHLSLALAEINVAVERYHQVGVPNGFDTTRFPSAHPFPPQPGEMT
tara:strand:+ start:446 stop:805 length:360 start_codon:yes stop_codon:yes gene_type:complete